MSRDFLNFLTMDSHDYAQQRQIDDLQMHLAAGADVGTEQMQKLFELDRAQEGQIRYLEACLNTLASMLIEAGVVDGPQLQQRVGAIMQKRADALSNKRDNPTSQCTRCQKTVPLANTMVTEYGHMCDPCYAALNA